MLVVLSPLAYNFVSALSALSLYALLKPLFQTPQEYPRSFCSLGLIASSPLITSIPPYCFIAVSVIHPTPLTNRSTGIIAVPVIHPTPLSYSYHRIL